jgi:hypothetical protein
MIRCGNIVFLTVRILDVEKFTTLIPLLLLISWKLSFKIVFYMVFRKFMEYMIRFLVEAVLHIINVILCWDMNVQNNNMTLATS